MLNILSGRVSCHLSLSGHLGGNPTRRGQELLVETDLLLRGNAPRGVKLLVSSHLGRLQLLLEVVVLETALVAENLFDKSLDKILSDVEWEPTVVEIQTPGVSLVVDDPVEDQEKLDPVEPVPDVEPKREKTPVASGPRCLRSSAPGRVKRKPTKKCRIHTQDMILEGVYWSDESEPESVEDRCLLLGLTRDIIDLD